MKPSKKSSSSKRTSPARKPLPRLAWPTLQTPRYDPSDDRPWWVAIADGQPISDEYIFSELKRDETGDFLGSDFFKNKIHQWRNEHPPNKNLDRISRALKRGKKGQPTKLPDTIPWLYDTLRVELKEIKRDLKNMKSLQRSRRWTTEDEIEELRKQCRHRLEARLAEKAVRTDFRKLTEADRSSDWFREEIQAMAQRFSLLPGWDGMVLQNVKTDKPSELAKTMLAERFKIGEDAINTAIRGGRKKGK